MRDASYHFGGTAARDEAAEVLSNSEARAKAIVRESEKRSTELVTEAEDRLAQIQVERESVAGYFESLRGVLSQAEKVTAVNPLPVNSAQAKSAQNAPKQTAPKQSTPKQNTPKQNTTASAPATPTETTADSAAEFDSLLSNIAHRAQDESALTVVDSDGQSTPATANSATGSAHESA